MLVLTRGLGEAVRIGDEIVVRVVGLHGGQVRLGIEAPRSVPVHRQEVYERIRAEAVAAGRGGGSEGRVGTKAA